LQQSSNRKKRRKLLRIDVELILELSMIRSPFSALEFSSVCPALVLIAGLVLVAFMAYRGSQPMQLAGADGMAYWQFVS
jgi:hypothetical protein